LGTGYPSFLGLHSLPHKTHVRQIYIKVLRYSSPAIYTTHYNNTTMPFLDHAVAKLFFQQPRQPRY